MFKEEDFQLSMESQLRLRIINDDIDNCQDKTALKAQLKDCIRMTMVYQQMLGKVLERTIVRDLDDWIEKVESFSQEGS